MKTPTTEEYLKAKVIVDLYEIENKILLNLKIEAFKVDLKKYFNTYTISGNRIKEFKLKVRLGDCGAFDIIPTDPPIEEDYDGENDKYIKVISEVIY